MYAAEGPIEFIKAQPRPANPLERLEMQQAADILRALLADIFLAHAGFLSTHSDENGRSVTLRLKIEADDGSELDIVVKEQDFLLPDGTRYNPTGIMLIVRDTLTEWGVMSFDYRLDKEEGKVIRTDRGDIRKDISLDPAIMESGDEEAIEKEQKRDMEDSFANRKLEVELGLNNQPVGFEEMTQVSQLVWSATPYTQVL